MAEDLVEHEAADILQRLKANPKVGIKNPEEVLRKLNVLIGGGFDKLLVNKFKNIDWINLLDLGDQWLWLYSQQICW